MSPSRARPTTLQAERPGQLRDLDARSEQLEDSDAGLLVSRKYQLANLSSPIDHMSDSIKQKLDHLDANTESLHNRVARIERELPAAQATFQTDPRRPQPQPNHIASQEVQLTSLEDEFKSAEALPK